MHVPHLVFACDSFKGTLSSAKTAELLARAASEVMPTATHTAIPMADGGEGTQDALVAALGGTSVAVTTHGMAMGSPDHASVDEASFGVLPNGTAVIEMAQVAGIRQSTLLPQDVARYGTFGVGELIRAALDRGCGHIIVTLGGSGTNDGGMGMMQMLGARLLDEDGSELSGIAANLGCVRSIDLSGMDSRIAHTRFTAMCDVDNPLTGSDGATYTFGPQKIGRPLGWKDDVLNELETGMVGYEGVLEHTFGRKVGSVPGAGAAGGLGAACLAFLGAELKPGIDTVLDLVGFDELLKQTDLVVTGEGRLDAQTAHGKVVCGIAAACAKRDVPCVAIAGSVEPGAEELRGLTAAMPLALGPCSLKECMENAEDLFFLAAKRTIGLYAAGLGANCAR